MEKRATWAWGAWRVGAHFITGADSGIGRAVSLAFAILSPPLCPRKRLKSSVRRPFSDARPSLPNSLQSLSFSQVVKPPTSLAKSMARQAAKCRSERRSKRNRNWHAETPRTRSIGRLKIASLSRAFCKASCQRGRKRFHLAAFHSTFNPPQPKLFELDAICGKLCSELIDIVGSW